MISHYTYFCQQISELIRLLTHSSISLGSFSIHSYHLFSNFSYHSCQYELKILFNFSLQLLGFSQVFDFIIISLPFILYNKLIAPFNKIQTTLSMTKRLQSKRASKQISKRPPMFNVQETHSVVTRQKNRNLTSNPSASNIFLTPNQHSQSNSEFKESPEFTNRKVQSHEAASQKIQHKFTALESSQHEIYKKQSFISRGKNKKIQKKTKNKEQMEQMEQMVNEKGKPRNRPSASQKTLALFYGKKHPAQYPKNKVYYIFKSLQDYLRGNPSFRQIKRSLYKILKKRQNQKFFNQIELIELILRNSLKIQDWKTILQGLLEGIKTIPQDKKKQFEIHLEGILENGANSDGKCVTEYRELYAIFLDQQVHKFVYESHFEFIFDVYRNQKVSKEELIQKYTNISYMKSAYQNFKILDKKYDKILVFLNPDLSKQISHSQDGGMDEEKIQSRKCNKEKQKVIKKSPKLNNDILKRKEFEEKEEQDRIEKQKDVQECSHIQGEQKSGPRDKSRKQEDQIESSKDQSVKLKLQKKKSEEEELKLIQVGLEFYAIEASVRRSEQSSYFDFLGPDYYSLEKRL